MMTERVEYEQRAPDHNPSTLGILLGVIRFTIVLPGLIVGSVLVLLAALVPIRIRGVRLASWIAMALSKLFARIFGIRIVCSDPKSLKSHDGLVFINHLSYLDPIVVKAIAPVRFLSTIGVRKMPFIGWIARSIGTVFVDRGSLRSRATTRREVTDQLRRRSHPPIVLAPEGQIGPGGFVLPFRRGAFNIAEDANVAILPLVIQFDPMEYAIWIKGEWIPRAVWRLAARVEPFIVTLTLLEAILPGSTDTGELVSETEKRYNRALKNSTLSSFRAG